MSQDVSGGTYLFASRELAFQLCPSFWDFASCLSCPATRFGNPLRNFFPLATATNHFCKIKNPASSAGRNHFTLKWLHALLDFFLPCTRKEPHYRI
jgi:hypothetical protein